MSVLEAPRITFRGSVSWDPIVTNNNPAQYDEANAETVFLPAEHVAGFRQAAIDATRIGRNWNPHGTHRSVFHDATVVGVDLGQGVSTDDPFVNAPIGFSGMLVDLEPYGSFSSQLFFDQISFGIDGGCRILGKRNDRMTARYINVGRNLTYRYIAGLASVVWQTCFAKADGLQIDAHDSPALQALAQALDDDDVLGLTVRWNSYRTIYYDSLDPAKNAALASELADKLDGGGFQPNPARSEMVGVIGLWRKGEPVHEPGDRALLANGSIPNPSQIASLPQIALSTAFARLTDDSLTLDFASSVSEIGIDLVKQDLGVLSVVAVDDNGNPIADLGSFGYDQYDREAYELSAGIIRLNVDPGDAAIAQGADIQVRYANGYPLLAEAALRAIPDAPNLYVDQGQSVTTQIRVLDRGVPAGAGVQVTVANAGATVTVVAQEQTDADGMVSFTANGLNGQVDGYLLVAGAGAPLPEGINPPLTNYMYVRTLPAEQNLTTLPATWANVQQQVLVNWEAMAPCMDNWLRLGDEAQVRAYAPMLLKLTDPAAFENFRFMPVTRDMTAGQRDLLHRFLTQSSPTPAAAELLTAAPPRAKATPEEDAARLSRAMRGN